MDTLYIWLQRESVTFYILFYRSVYSGSFFFMVVAIDTVDVGIGHVNLSKVLFHRRQVKDYLLKKHRNKFKNKKSEWND